jgi:chemotaxis protein MotD
MTLLNPGGLVALAALQQANSGDAPTLDPAETARVPLMQRGDADQVAIELPNKPALKLGERAGEPRSALAADPRVTVLARATHFAPTLAPAHFSEALASEATAASQVRPSPMERDIPSLGGRSVANRDAVADSARSVVSAVREMASAASDRAWQPQAASIDAPESAEPEAKPSGTGLPAGQLERIAVAIADDTNGLVPDAPLLPSVSGGAPPVAAQPTPVRTLKIQLHPADLGVLHVEMHVRGGALSVKVRPSHDDTARLLENDRQALTDLLRSAGRDVEALTIQALPREVPLPASDLQSAPPRGQAQTSTQGDRQAGAEGRSSQEQPETRRNSFQQGHENHARSSGESGNGRDLYV